MNSDLCAIVYFRGLFKFDNAKEFREKKYSLKEMYLRQSAPVNILLKFTLSVHAQIYIIPEKNMNLHIFYVVQRYVLPMLFRVCSMMCGSWSVR